MQPDANRAAARGRPSATVPGSPNPEVLDQVVRRIVESVHPLRIILFGSAARGEMGPDSDIDVLVVMPEGVHPRRTAQHLFTRMSGIPASVDVVVATPSVLERYQHSFGLVYREALRDGKDLYVA